MKNNPVIYTDPDGRKKKEDKTDISKKENTKKEPEKSLDLSNLFVDGSRDDEKKITEEGKQEIEDIMNELKKIDPTVSVNKEGMITHGGEAQKGYEKGYELLDSLIKGKTKVTIMDSIHDRTGKSEGANKFALENETVYWNKDNSVPFPIAEGSGISNEPNPTVSLAHELIHAMHWQQGKIDYSEADYKDAKGIMRKAPLEELKTIGIGKYRNGVTENDIRREINARKKPGEKKIPIRTGYTKDDKKKHM